MKKDWGAFVSKDIVLEPTGVGKLQEMSFAVKDVFAIKGHTSGAGNPDWLRTHAPADQNAESIDRLLQQGAKMTGTTQTDELMYSLNGENFHYGTPVNPKSPNRIPGGSSSGSAVAVSAGLVDFALGTDTGGSIRIPAAYCGIYGFRPTHGLVDMSGIIPLAESFDTLGWMARDPSVLLKVGLSLIDGPYPTDNSFKRIYLGNDAWDLADADYMGLASHPIKLLTREAGYSESVEVASEGLEAWMHVFRTLQGLEIWSAHSQWIQTENPTFGLGIAERFAWASSLQDVDGKYHQMREDIKKRMLDLLREDGILIIPTAPGIAPLLQQSGEFMENRRAKTLQLTCIAGLAGFPQITIPMTSAEGSAYGISMIAGPGQDIKLLTWANEIDWMINDKENA